MSASDSIRANKHLRQRIASVLAAVAALGLVIPMETASAASSINPPSNLVCEKFDNKLSVNAPRVWASYRTEQVLWIAVIERWDGYRWNVYKRYDFYSSFNIYGQSVTSWGGWYHNNTMNIPVYHAGYYRMAGHVAGNQGGVTWTGYVGGGSYCRVY